MHTPACMPTHSHLHVLAHSTHSSTHSHSCTHMHIPTHAHSPTCTHTYTRAHTHLHSHLPHMHTHVHTHTRVHTHAHTYTQKQLYKVLAARLVMLADTSPDVTEPHPARISHRVRVLRGGHEDPEAGCQGQPRSRASHPQTNTWHMGVAAVTAGTPCPLHYDQGQENVPENRGRQAWRGRSCGSEP